MARRIRNGEWGLQTEAGERGARLSMGQRQLSALLRVLVQHPTIFILDDATAHTDPFTESRIRVALAIILAEKTLALIAHRLSTVKSTDRIMVMRLVKTTRREIASG